MSTADNDTITLAAEIGKRRPNFPARDIGKVAGKLVKLCASLSKRDDINLLEHAQELALDIGAVLMACDNPVFIDGAKSYYLTFAAGDHVPIGSLRIVL